MRIRGSILDQIRKMDWIPRSVRQKQKAISEAAKKLEAMLGPNYADEDMAKELGISEEEYNTWLSQTNISNVSSLDDIMEQGSDVKNTGSGSSNIDPESSVVKEELKEQLVRALSALTEKEKKVVMLYYYEELTLKEISRVMEVSESRVSQLHSKALTKMRGYLGDNFALMMG